MVDFNGALVVGISSRALFDLEEEDAIFRTKGVRAYSDYQLKHENDVLRRGAAFPLAKALLALNDDAGERVTEIIVMSRNSADTSLRIMNSIEHYGLDITRTALTGGRPIAPYLPAFGADLFLSANEADVQDAVNGGAAAGLILAGNYDTAAEVDELRLAFDGDAVLFGDESERIYKEKGLDAFQENERLLANTPLTEGPFAQLLKSVSRLQRLYGAAELPIRTALVTARNAPAHKRVIHTLRAWDVSVDETFFLGGMMKRDVLKAFGAHIFFDDQATHTNPASEVVPTARVPWRNSKTLTEEKQ